MVLFQPYSAKMKSTTDEDKKNMYLRIIVSLHCSFSCVTLHMLFYKQLNYFYLKTFP